MRECFAGPSWTDLSRNVTAVNTDEDRLTTELWEFTKEMLPDNAADEQLTCLWKMKFNAKDWVKSIQVINNYAFIISEDAIPFTNNEILK